MLGASMQLTEPSDRELVISRVLDAPPARVFRAWTEPAQLAQWWGPGGFTNPVVEVDLRPGGAYRIVMQAPDGTQYAVLGVYREIDPPRRLVYTDAFEGLPAEWLHLFNERRHQPPDEPVRDLLVTVTFDEQDGGTLVRIHTTFEATTDREALLQMGMAEGWAQSLDRLAALLARGSHDG